MALIIGLSFSLAVLTLFSYLQYPNSTFKATKHFILRKKSKLNKNLALIWPDVVDELASAIRAGLSLPQSILVLSDSGPEIIRPIFHEAMQRYQLTGDFVGSLNTLGELVKDPIADKFVSALQIAYEVGGTDLGNLLRTLSEVIREDNKLHGEIEARQSWTVNGAKLAIAAPWLTVLILSTRQSALSVYFSKSGILLLSVCAAISILAYFAMVRIAKLPVAIRIRS